MRIELSFEKSMTRLAGFPFGKVTYDNQVKSLVPDINAVDEKICIVFPSQIEKAASSFVQGFFSEMINTIGYDEIEKRFDIESASEKLTASIIQNIR